MMHYVQRKTNTKEQQRVNQSINSIRILDLLDLSPREIVSLQVLLVSVEVKRKTKYIREEVSKLKERVYTVYSTVRCEQCKINKINETVELNSCYSAINQPLITSVNLIANHCSAFPKAISHAILIGDILTVSFVSIFFVH